MKGTLFSADFIKDNTTELRLLEINTDTGISIDVQQNVNLDSFFNVLSGSAITELHIIYKPYIHNELVSYISESAQTNATFITDITLQAEEANTIYPAAVEDSSDKFILRMAYDESAIFDSNYAKDRTKVFNLFTTSSLNDYTPGYYYSSSEDGVVDTIDKSMNSSNLPDAVIKDAEEQQRPLSFYKIGSEVSDESNESRWDAFISESRDSNKVIEQYHYHSSSLSDNNKLTSFRYIGIVYGSNLDIVPLTSFKGEAIFEIPSDISSEFNSNQYTNELASHHYYEYTTNYLKDGSNGVLDIHEIIMADGSSETLADISVSGSVKSYFISGSPQTENDIETSTWQVEGKEFPSGSYITSSEVVFKEEKDLQYGALIEVTVDGDSIYSGVSKQFLIYNSGSNITRYKTAENLDPDEDYFFDLNGNLIDIDSSSLYITSDTDAKIVELDVEDTDTYVISGSTAFHSIVTHNAPCFVAGTNITLGDGSLKPIENVGIGEEVLTYNFKTNSVEPNLVRAIGTKKVGSIVTYEFEDGSTLKATLDHPLYCNKHGWVSMNTEFTSAVYNLQTSQASVGCEILKQDKSVSKLKSIVIDESETIVHNLRTVEVNHNFFANEYLVHNRGGCFTAGTKISLFESGEDDEAFINIEDVVVGDKIKTFNQDTGVHELGEVGELKKHEVLTTLEILFNNNTKLVTTPEHPLWCPVREEWIPAGDFLPSDNCILENGDDVQIVDITKIEGNHTVYNLLTVTPNHNFYANGILVHNKF